MKPEREITTLVQGIMRSALTLFGDDLRHDPVAQMFSERRRLSRAFGENAWQRIVRMHRGNGLERIVRPAVCAPGAQGRITYVWHANVAIGYSCSANLDGAAWPIIAWCVALEEQQLPFRAIARQRCQYPGVLVAVLLRETSLTSGALRTCSAAGCSWHCKHATALARPEPGVLRLHPGFRGRLTSAVAMS